MKEPVFFRPMSVACLKKSVTRSNFYFILTNRYRDHVKKPSFEMLGVEEEYFLSENSGRPMQLCMVRQTQFIVLNKKSNDDFELLMLF